jgi:hypothetical protein
MVKTMFEGFKINIDLEVAGSIVKTNAEYVTGSRITLLEMDLGLLFQDQEKLKALQGKVGPGASLSEVKPYLKDVKDQDHGRQHGGAQIDESDSWERSRIWRTLTS